MENITIIKINLYNRDHYINNEIIDEKPGKSTAVTLLYSRFRVCPSHIMLIPRVGLQGGLYNILNFNISLSFKA